MKKLSKYYEIVVFTAAVAEYAELVVKKLDPLCKRISHVLSRKHITIINSQISKDLSKLGRDLDSVIIVDDKPDNFRF